MFIASSTDCWQYLDMRGTLPVCEADYHSKSHSFYVWQAEFYSCAAFGQPLASELRGGGPASTGCQKASLSASAQEIAEEIANNEIAHVTYLRSALGSAAVPIPQIDIGSAFSSAADAAAGASLTPAFSPYANDLDFFLGAFIFEVRVQLVVANIASVSSMLYSTGSSSEIGILVL